MSAGPTSDADQIVRGEGLTAGTHGQDELLANVESLRELRSSRSVK